LAGEIQITQCCVSVPPAWWAFDRRGAGLTADGWARATVLLEAAAGPSMTITRTADLVGP
jgi:hypothetical protein